MNIKAFLTVLVISLVSGFVNVYAAKLNGEANNTSGNRELEQKLQSLFEGLPVQITDYNADLKQIVVGAEHFFASNDGRYIYAGSVLDTQRKVDVSAERDASIRKTVLEQQPKALFISYPSKVKQEHQITVFTDIDCPYCRKLHVSIDELNQNGVSVRYVMMPRQGEGSQTYLKTASALCSSDAAQSIDGAMRGEVLEPKNCDSTQLSDHLELARRLKINSTPTLVLPNGELQIGLRNTEQMMQLLEQQSSNQG